MRRRICILSVVSLVWVACGDDDTSDNNNNNLNSTGQCGDGVQDQGEACDDGTLNSDAVPDACRTDCRLPYCGDGVADNDENCDDGMSNSDTDPDACRTDCRAAHCQDGVVDQEEACDDGNDGAGDGCAPDCSVEDRWACASSPSICTCADYYLGPDCAGCAVRVKVDTIGVIPDGVDWDTAFTTVQEGIELAEQLGPGCEVWVAGGTYYIYDADPANTVYMRSGVSLFGGFAGTETTRDQRDWAANPTVLDGLREGSTPFDAGFVSHVITAIDTEDATLDGFVVTGGWAQSGVPPFGNNGGGLIVARSIATSDIGVVNCTFYSNASDDNGGAIAVDWGTLRVISSTFYGNDSALGGGISGRNLADVTVTDSTFSMNTAIDDGGGIHGPWGELSVTNSVFYGNYVHVAGGQGGGIYGSSSTVIRSSTFVNNVSQSTGAAVYQAAEVTNCVFEGNSVNAIASVSSVTYSQVEVFTGGAENATGSPLLVRLPDFLAVGILQGPSLLTAINTSLFAVGDVIEIGSEGVLRTVTQIDTLVWFAPPITEYQWGLVIVENWGVGSTAITEDLTLQSSSPCIDTANDAAAPPLDHNGNPRVDVAGVGTAGTLADRGAFEYQP